MLLASAPPCAASKLLWLQRHEPQHWERLAHVLLPHDFINFWLTGRLCMEARPRGSGWAMCVCV